VPIALTRPGVPSPATVLTTSDTASRRRTLSFSVSATYRRVESSERPFGWLNLAAVPTPFAKPAEAPARVDTAPLGSILRIKWFPLSAT
jgi:hypothetical protein